MDAHDYIKIGGLIPASTAVFLCDLQEKFRPVMLHYAEVIKTASKLVINECLTCESGERISSLVLNCSR